MTISARIRKLLKEKKITQKALSEVAGVTQSAVTVWFKTNTDSIPSSAIMPTCELLGITPLELLTGEAPEPQAQVEPDDPNKLTDDEEKLIAIYRQLDWQAKQMVTAAAISELRREQNHSGGSDSSETSTGKVG